MNISAELFKKRCFQLITTVQKSKKEIVITKFGKPIAKLVPILKKAKTKSLFGCMKGTVKIHGDIIASTGEQWFADQ